MNMKNHQVCIKVINSDYKIFDSRKIRPVIAALIGVLCPNNIHNRYDVFEINACCHSVTLRRYECLIVVSVVPVA